MEINLIVRDVLLGVAILFLCVRLIGWVEGIGAKVEKLQRVQEKILALKREELQAAADGVGPDPPKSAHPQSQSYRNWAEPWEALARFDAAFPEVKK